MQRYGFSVALVKCLAHFFGCEGENPNRKGDFFSFLCDLRQLVLKCC